MRAVEGALNVELGKRSSAQDAPFDCGWHRLSKFGQGYKPAFAQGALH
jgi:hypothetical protein